MLDSYKQLKAAADEHGDAFYILDSRLFEQNYDDMLSAFCSYYPNTHIAYSYKTNYMPKLCRIIQEKGGYAEVVSELEWQLAVKTGVKPSDIYYNGPYKKKEYIEKCLLSGVHINLDSMYEVEIVAEIAKRNRDRKLEAGIRCNVDIGQDEPSRFGFYTQSGELVGIVRKLNDLGNVKVTGLHCHLPFRSLDSFKERVRIMYTILEQFPEYEWSYLSFGGGYMGKVDEEMARTFAFVPPTYEDYAQVVAGGMKVFFENRQHKPKLIIEPGSALVADTMKYVTRVVDIKYVRDKYIATLSGSIYNMNPSTKGIKRPIAVYSDKQQEHFYENVDMAGYTCIESDYLYRGYQGNLSRGDFVVFHNVGSYSLVMKPPFILPDVPCLEEDGEKTVIVKKKQREESIFADFI